jgi:transposase
VDGQAVQPGFAQAGGCGDRRWGIDTSGGGPVFDRDSDRRNLGAAEAGNWRCSPAKQGKPKGAVLDAHADFILGALAEAPDTTLDEMAERLREERGVTVVRTAVWKFLDRHGQTHKKRPRMRASKRALM